MSAAVFCGMFSLAYERSQKVLVARFIGSMTKADLNELDERVVAFIKVEGPPRAFVIDATEVVTLEVPTTEFVRRAKRPSRVSDTERVYIMPSADLYGMGRLFGTYQRMAGKREPLVVKTLAEAYYELKLTDPKFEPV